MKISHAWLQDFFEKPLPTPEKIAELVTMHSFEIESMTTLGRDTIFDIKVLPDRSHDCLSHRGIAQEVALLAGLKVKDSVKNLPELAVPESNLLKGEVAVLNLCKRFSALVLENIEVKESPEWLRSRLESLGQRSINNVVDATNYVMLALGQPLHAYDSALLAHSDGGKKLLVRFAEEEERVVGLDGKEYALSSSALVIADGGSGKAIGIAGIKGGKAAEITERTKTIILEAANFDPISIRQSAKQIGLRTDASVRFENEITPELTTLALKQVSDLILEIAGTAESRVEGMIDWYPRKAAPYKVGLSLQEIEGVLGIKMSPEDVGDILTRRDYAWKLVNPREVIVSLAQNLLGTPYKFGSSVLHDSPRTFDCSSFSSYVYVEAGLAIPRVCNDQFLRGYSIDEKEAKPGDMVFFESKREGLPKGAAGHNALYLGDGEMIHAGGVDKGYGKVVKEVITESKYYATGFLGYRRLLPDEEPRFVVTIPPERLDLRIKEDLIEEIGRIYGYENLTSQTLSSFAGRQEKEKHFSLVSILRSLFVNRGFSEVYSYAFRKSGEVAVENPLAQDKGFLRADLASGLSEALALNSRNRDLLALEAIRIFEIGKVFRKEGEYLSLAFGVEDGKGNILREDAEQMIAAIEKTLEVKDVFAEKGSVYEANLDTVLEKVTLPVVEKEYKSPEPTLYKAFSEYPFILRDIAVFVPEGENQEEIIDIVQRAAGGLLVAHRLFDQFTKEFPEGKKTSFAYRLVFQSFEKTLTDEEINPVMEKATTALNNKPGWQVR